MDKYGEEKEWAEQLEDEAMDKFREHCVDCDTYELLDEYGLCQQCQKEDK